MFNNYIVKEVKDNMKKQDLVNEKIGINYPHSSQTNENLLIESILSVTNTELVNDFFSQVESSNGTQIILDFLERNFLKFFWLPDSYHEYQALGDNLFGLPLKNILNGCRVLEYFLDNTPSTDHKACCITNIVFKAIHNPEAYTTLQPKLIDIVNESKDILTAELNDFFIIFEKDEKAQHFVKNNLNFQPITETQPLITSEINEVAPLINNILKKTRTDLVGEDRNTLVKLLNKHLSELIEVPVFNYVFDKMQLADIYIYKTPGGGGYKRTYDYNKPVIIIEGAERYVNGIEIDLITALAHEATHCLLDSTFNNDRKPFHPDNKHEEQRWSSLLDGIMSRIKKEAPSLDMITDEKSSLSDGDNELMLISYKSVNLLKELPAFALQEEVIRKLIPSITRPSIIQESGLDIMGFLYGIMSLEHSNEIKSSLTGETSDLYFNLEFDH